MAYYSFMKQTQSSPQIISAYEVLHLGGGSWSSTAPGPPHLLELHSNFCKSFNDDCNENILKEEQERMADTKLASRKKNKLILIWSAFQTGLKEHIFQYLNKPGQKEN